MIPPSQNPPPDPGAAADEPYKPRPLQLDLPGAKADAEPVQQPAPQHAVRRPGRTARTLAIALGGLIVLAASAAAVTVWLVLPWYVVRQSIEVAAEHGIALTIDSARIEPQGFRLAGVHATWTAVPGVRAQASEIEVETSGLRPQKMTVRGADLTLNGPFGAIESDFESWRASANGGQAGAWAPGSLVLEGARVGWQSPTGESVRVDATDVHAEVAWHERGLDLHARSDQVVVALPGGTLGPWRVDVDRLPGSSRVRLALDPAVPESCTILIVGDGKRTTSLDVVVPRSPLDHLGVPAQLLGVSGKAVQVECTAHYVALGPTRADAQVTGGIHGIGAPGLPLLLDVAWEGTASGDPIAGIDIKKARLAVGPLVGPLTGTIKSFDDGFRFDLGWAAGPIPCAAFAKATGLGLPFDIGYALRSLGRSARAADSDVRAAIAVSFDSRDLSATKVDFKPEIRCAASFFQ